MGRKPNRLLKGGKIRETDREQTLQTLRYHGKGGDSPYNLLKEHNSANTLISASEVSVQTSDLQNYKRIICVV